MRLLLIILICFFFLPVKGSGISDTLVFADEIAYSDSFERNSLTSFLHDNSQDYFRMFLASSGNYSEAEYQKAYGIYKDFMNKLNTPKFSSSGAKKKIKMIYQQVHDKFFRKYELQTNFSAIFKNGNYNCVTATALYGIILKELDIPFAVVETPIHVYLIAYPDNEDIKIETTDPLTGYFVLDQKTKKSFVDYMIKNKMVSESESNSSTTDELFNKYYFPDSRIHLKELLAIHYYNMAIQELTGNKNKLAYDYFEKSYLLYPTERTAFLMFVTLAEILKNLEYRKVGELKYLVKIARFDKFGVTVNDIKGEFARITDYHLVNRSNINYYDTVYNYLISNIDSITYRNEISYLYYYEKGRYLMNKTRYQESHENFLQAYELKPLNSDAQGAFVQSLALLMNQLSVSDALERTEKYYNEIEELKSNKTFVSLLLHIYLLNAYQQFNLLHPLKAESSLKIFELIYEKNSEIDIMPDAIGDAYSAAGVYYFKRGNYKRAKEYIDKGLYYAPGNFKLIMSHNSF